MTPYYHGFKGTVSAQSTTGVITELGSTVLEVTELPIGMWNQTFKTNLESMVEALHISAFTEHHTDYEVKYRIQVTADQMTKLKETGLIKVFKLSKPIKSNLVAFNANGKLITYDSVENMLREYYVVRLRLYQTRKEFDLARMTDDAQVREVRVRFLQCVMGGSIPLHNVSKVDVIQKLTDLQFPTREGTYDYLLSLTLWSLTKERVQREMEQLAQLHTEIATLQGTSEIQLWTADLTALLTQMNVEIHQALLDRATTPKAVVLGQPSPKKRKVGA